MYYSSITEWPMHVKSGRLLLNQIVVIAILIDHHCEEAKEARISFRFISAK